VQELYNTEIARLVTETIKWWLLM